MQITSVFGPNQEIPVKYTCMGENISPSLTIDDAPAGSRSLVLVMLELESNKTPLILWHLFNIPPGIKVIYEGKVPEDAVEGFCSNHTFDYEGPCPKYFKGVRHYVFRAYALSVVLDLPHTSTFETVSREMEGHILTTAELTGIVTAEIYE